MTRASGAASKAKQYLLEPLRSLVEIAAIEMREGNKEMALVVVTHCLQHSSHQREVTDLAESLRAELIVQLTPQQIETAEARARVKTLEGLAQEILAAH